MADIFTSLEHGLIIGSDGFCITESATEPTAVAGKTILYSNGTNLKFSLNGGAFSNLSPSGCTLDSAYDYGGAGVGRAISTTDGAVTMGNTEADTTNILELTKSPSGSAAGSALTITMGANATGAGMTFTNAGSGNDVTGTSSTWSITKAGAVTAASLNCSSGAITGGALTGSSLTVVAGAITAGSIGSATTGAFALEAGTSGALTIQAVSTGTWTLGVGGGAGTLGKAGSALTVNSNVTFAGTVAGITSITGMTSITMSQSSDASAITIDKSGTGAGDVVDIENDGTGDALFINQDGNGRAIDIDSESTTANIVNIEGVLAGGGVGLRVYNNGVHVAGNSLVEFVEDNAGSDRSLIGFQQDGTGYTFLALTDDQDISMKLAGTGVFKVFDSGSTDYVSIDHDGTDAYIKTLDGSFVFQTDEGTNTNSVIVAMGKGTGYGILQANDEDDAEYVQIACSSGVGLIATAGSSPSTLKLQDAAHAGVTLFGSAAEGETPSFTVTGYPTGGASKTVSLLIGGTTNPYGLIQTSAATDIHIDAVDATADSTITFENSGATYEANVITTGYHTINTTQASKTSLTIASASTTSPVGIDVSFTGNGDSTALTVQNTSTVTSTTGYLASITNNETAGTPVSLAKGVLQLVQDDDSSTGHVLFINNDASATSNSINIDHEGSGSAIVLNTAGTGAAVAITLSGNNDNTGLTISNTNTVDTTTGYLATLTNNETAAVPSSLAKGVLSLVQQDDSSTGHVLNIDCNASGTANGIYIDQAGTAAAIAINLSGNNDNLGLSIQNTSSQATTTGSLVTFTNNETAAYTGQAKVVMTLTQDGANSRGHVLSIDNDATVTSNSVKIDHEGTGDIFLIDGAATGNFFNIDATGTAAGPTIFDIDFTTNGDNFVMNVANTTDITSTTGYLFIISNNETAGVPVSLAKGIFSLIQNDGSSTGDVINIDNNGVATSRSIYIDHAGAGDAISINNSGALGNSIGIVVANVGTPAGNAINIDVNETATVKAINIDTEVADAHGVHIDSAANAANIAALFVDASAISANSPAVALIKSSNDAGNTAPVLALNHKNAATAAAVHITSVDTNEAIKIDPNGTGAISLMNRVRISADTAPGTITEADGASATLYCQGVSEFDGLVTMDGGLTVSAGTVTLPEQTTGQIWIGAEQARAISGTWTLTYSGGVASFDRTANGSAQSCLIPIMLPNDTTASKGFKITSLEVIYTIETEAADDVTVSLNKVAIPADNVAIAATSQTLGSGLTPDADHDSAAERGDHTSGPELHTMVLSVSSAAYGANDSGYNMLFTVDDTTGGNAVVKFKGVQVYYSKTY